LRRACGEPTRLCKDFDAIHILKAPGQLITAAPALTLVVLQISRFQIMMTPTGINRQGVFRGHRCHGDNKFNPLGNTGARDVNDFVALAFG
jgi:hypothetical protein